MSTCNADATRGALGVSLTALSNHLKRLREVWLLTATASGRHVIYELAGQDSAR